MEHIIESCGKMYRLEALIKKDKNIMIAAIAFLAVLIGSLVWIYQINNTKPTQLLNVEKINQGAYINTIDVPYGFARKVGQSSWLAIAYDENNYLYIVQLTEAQYTTIENYFELAGEDATFEIKGVTREIDENISKLALEAYNEVVSEDKQIEKEDFNKYFGNLYIEMGTTSDISLQMVIATISSIMFISFLIVGFISKNRTKKTMESEMYQRALEEADNPEFDTKNTILTKNYLIYYASGLHIVEYKDISWIYRHTVRYNGVPNHAFAYYLKGSKKMNLIGVGFDVKKVEELLSFVSKKNPNVLVGYTEGNRKAHRETI